MLVGSMDGYNAFQMCPAPSGMANGPVIVI
jgi:hypothetical protein